MPALTSLILAGLGLSASTLAINTNPILLGEDVTQRPYLELNLDHALYRRDVIVNADVDNDSRDEAVNINDNGTLNMTVWDAATDAACVQALSSLPRSSNPSGTCICYNLPSLDATTGVFAAELRLYRVSEARDSFTNVPPENVRMSLQYSGASVSPVSAAELSSMHVAANQTQEPSLSRRDSVPQLMEVYLFVGQIDKDKVAQNLSMYVRNSLHLSVSPW